MEKLNLNIPEAEVFYDKNRKYVKILWTEAANKVTPEEGLEITKKVIDYILELDPVYLLIDHQNLTFPYTKEFREGVAKDISPKVAARGTIKKIAYIMSRDIITTIGLQLMQEDLTQSASFLKRAFFQSVEEGEKWLFTD